MDVRGAGELCERLASVEQDGGVDDPIVTVDSARSSHSVADLSREFTDGGPITIVFADDQLLFALRTELRRTRPCPRCLLRHLVADAEQVRLLDDGEDVPPSDAVLEYATSRSFVATLEDLADTALPAVAVIDVEEESETWSGTVVPHPACSHDDLPARLSSEETVASLDSARETLTDPHFGIVRRLDCERAETLPNGSVFYVSTTLVHNTAFHHFPDRFDPFERAGGAGFDPERTTLRGLMEGVERYAMLVPESDGVTATASELDQPVLSPDQFYRYDDEQYERDGFPYARYDPNEAYRWVSVTDLETGQRVLVPEGFAQFLPSAATDSMLVESTSSGCAAHFSQSEAILEGVLELFERDALLFQWYDRTPTDHLAHPTLPERARDVVEYVENSGYEVAVADVTRFDPFTCVVVTFAAPDRDAPPYAVCAADCSLDPTDAVESAVFEAFNTLVETRDDDQFVPSAADVTTTMDHHRYYQHPDRLDRLAPFTEPARVRAFSPDDRDGTLEYAVGALADLDVRVLFRDRTPSHLSERGVAVVRTLSPDLIPITFGHRHERLDHPERPISDPRQRSIPHPFP